MYTPINDCPDSAGAMFRIVTPGTKTPCEIFFCMDCTQSMWGLGGDHGAQDSVAKFLTDFASQGVIFKLGGIKFNEPGSYNPGPGDSIDPNELTHLGAITSTGNFINNWIYDGYRPDGGDAPERQLDALDSAAQDMNARSISGNPNRYIVLITDSVFHCLGDGGPSTLIKGDTNSGEIQKLTATGCEVYISLWDNGTWQPALQTTYGGLTVNGGEFDPPDMDSGTTSNALYPLNKLRTRIMANWPSN